MLNNIVKIHVLQMKRNDMKLLHFLALIRLTGASLATPTPAPTPTPTKRTNKSTERDEDEEEKEQKATAVAEKTNSFSRAQGTSSNGPQHYNFGSDQHESQAKQSEIAHQE